MAASTSEAACSALSRHLFDGADEAVIEYVQM